MRERQGLLLGALAYLLWGLFPLYWPLLAPAGAVEILAHRMIWSLVIMAVVVVVAKRLPQLSAILRDRRVFGLLAVAAVAVTVNWGSYIWGVNHGRTVEASLGYFVNPLVTMLLGVIFLRERLRRMQWVAVGIAVVAVVVLGVDYGRLPWLALALAFSFGIYGLMKKKAGAGAFESLTVETALMTPFALLYVVWLAAHGTGHFTSDGAGHTLLFIGSGAVTSIPLVLFGAAATRVTMVTLGLVQYLAPIIQFAIGVFVQHEAMSPGRWIGFVIVWIALAVFTYEALGYRRTQLAEAAQATV